MYVTTLISVIARKVNYYGCTDLKHVNNLEGAMNKIGKTCYHSKEHMT